MIRWRLGALVRACRAAEGGAGAHSLLLRQYRDTIRLAGAGAAAAAVAGHVLALTPIGGFLLSTLIFGGAVTGDVALSIVLIVAGDHPDPARPTVTIPGVRGMIARHQMEDHQ